MEGCEAGRSVSQSINEDEPLVQEVTCTQSLRGRSAPHGVAQEKEDCEVGGKGSVVIQRGLMKK